MVGGMNAKDTSLWVFGYGSLCWNPGFKYGQEVIGSISGFARRFWQGNVTHRGTPGKPGRVATLVPEPNVLTHGVAFQLLGESALEYLNQREVSLGGYNTYLTEFAPKDKDKSGFHVLVYVATPSNQHWLGPAPAEEVAQQVVDSSGNSGHNVEYVVRLAEWMRWAHPDAEDAHLDEIERHLRRLIKENNLCMNTMMKAGCCVIHDDLVDDERQSGGYDPESVDYASPHNFTSKVTKKTLRCVKI